MGSLYSVTEFIWIVYVCPLNCQLKMKSDIYIRMKNEQPKFDSQHIWHPLYFVNQPLPVYPVKRAEGVYLELEDGRRLIDGMSSWWACIHGYNVPELNAPRKISCRIWHM